VGKSSNIILGIPVVEGLVWECSDILGEELVLEPAGIPVLEHSRTVQLEPKIRQMVILVFRFIIFNK
jgi:hypothetical protein